MLCVCVYLEMGVYSNISVCYITMMLITRLVFNLVFRVAGQVSCPKMFDATTCSKSSSFTRLAKSVRNLSE